MKVRLMALVAAFCLVVGLPLAAMAGPTPGLSGDGDSDGVENAFDNCSSESNPAQKDEDHDGCGNVCDADIDQNGTTGISDFVLFADSFGISLGSPGYVPGGDLDCNGTVGISDFVLFADEFGSGAGPSGISNSSRDLTGCP